MIDRSMKNRWIALYVENTVGVLAKVSGLFSGKSYNLQSLTVGTTEDETVSRMTICVTSDDVTFEQIKKQLNCMVEVIKVIDLTNVPIHMKEILFAKVKDISAAEKAEVFQFAQVFEVKVKDIGTDTAAIGAGALIAGMITAAVVGFLAIKLLRWIVTTNRLEIFAYYTLIVGGVTMILGIIEHVMGQNIFTGRPL